MPERSDVIIAYNEYQPVFGSTAISIGATVGLRRGSYFCASSAGQVSISLSWILENRVLDIKQSKVLEWFQIKTRFGPTIALWIINVLVSLVRPVFRLAACNLILNIAYPRRSSVTSNSAVA